MADRVITTEPIALVCADGGVCGVNGTATHGTYAFVYIGESGAVVHCESGMVNPTADVPRVTNNVSELVAILRALRSLPDGWSGTVYSDSENALGRVFRGWGLAGVPECYVNYLPKVLPRLGAVEYVLLDGHPTRKQLEEGIGKRGHPVSKHNVTCDRLCNEARAVWEKQKKAVCTNPL